MAKKPMSEKQKKERAAKAAATRAANKEKALKQLGLDERKPKKTRRVRKPMTEEQRQAAAKRLEKAREARFKDSDGPKYLSFDESIRDIPEDNPFSIKKVQSYIRAQKEHLKDIKSFKNSKVASERDEYNRTVVYIENLKTYLKTGVYLDHMYGDNKDQPVKRVCVKMSYDSEGTPKRTQGLWYPDLGTTWLGEDDE